MAFENIIARGIGFTPEGVNFIVTHGFGIAISAEIIAASDRRIFTTDTKRRVFTTDIKRRIFTNDTKRRTFEVD